MSAQDKCPAKLELADDEGDNSTTFKCRLEVGHIGPHQEKTVRSEGNWCLMTWEGMEPYQYDEEDEPEESG